jgi:hypothetical protein
MGTGEELGFGGLPEEALELVAGVVILFLLEGR